MAAGQNGHSGARLVQHVGVDLKQRGIVLALIRHRYMVVPTALGSQKKRKTAVYLLVQVIINAIRADLSRMVVLRKTISAVSFSRFLLLSAYKLSVRYYNRLDVRQYCFSNRIVSVWQIIVK